MIEPFTVTAAVLVVDRAYDRAARARQRRALLNLLSSELSRGGEVGEHYGPHGGWYIKIPAATSTDEAAISAVPPPADGGPARRARICGRVRVQRRGRQEK